MPTYLPMWASLKQKSGNCWSRETYSALPISMSPTVKEDQWRTAECDFVTIHTLKNFLQKRKKKGEKGKIYTDPSLSDKNSRQYISHIDLLPCRIRARVRGTRARLAGVPRKLSIRGPRYWENKPPARSRNRAGIYTERNSAAVATTVEPRRYHISKSRSHREAHAGSRPRHDISVGDEKPWQNARTERMTESPLPAIAFDPLTGSSRSSSRIMNLNQLASRVNSQRGATRQRQRRWKRRVSIPLTHERAT